MQDNYFHRNYLFLLFLFLLFSCFLYFCYTDVTAPSRRPSDNQNYLSLRGAQLRRIRSLYEYLKVKDSSL